MEQYLQLGAVAIIFALAIREFFSYLKARKNGGGLTTQIKMIGDNHLEHMYDEMKEQTKQHNEMIKVLTQINTKLDK